MSYRINIGLHEVVVTHRRQSRRISMRYHRDLNRFTVSAPSYLSRSDIDEFLISNQGWMDQHKPYDLPRREEKSSDTMKLLGVSYPVEWIDSDRDEGEMSFENDVVRIVVSEEADRQYFYQQVKRILHRRMLKDVVPGLLAKWQRIMGLPDIEWRIRDMRTRWGTCIPARKRVWLRQSLGAKSIELIELVIVHELCHFFEQSHSSRFYEHMARFLPNYSELNKLLLDD